MVPLVGVQSGLDPWAFGLQIQLLIIGEIEENQNSNEIKEIELEKLNLLSGTKHLNEVELVRREALRSQL